MNKKPKTIPNGKKISIQKYKEKANTHKKNSKDNSKYMHFVSPKIFYFLNLDFII